MALEALKRYKNVSCRRLWYDKIYINSLTVRIKFTLYVIENMFKTISMNVFTIYMSNFQPGEQSKITYGSVTITITSKNRYETDGEYHLQRIISPIALSYDNAWLG